MAGGVSPDSAFLLSSSARLIISSFTSLDLRSPPATSPICRLTSVFRGASLSPTRSRMSPRFYLRIFLTVIQLALFSTCHGQRWTSAFRKCSILPSCLCAGAGLPTAMTRLMRLDQKEVISAWQCGKNPDLGSQRWRLGPYPVFKPLVSITRDNHVNHRGLCVIWRARLSGDYLSQLLLQAQVLGTVENLV